MRQFYEKKTESNWSLVRWISALFYLLFAISVFLWPTTKDEKLSVTFSQQDIKVKLLKQNPQLRLQSSTVKQNTPGQNLLIDLPAQDLNLRLPETEVTSNLTVPTKVTRLQELVKAISAPLALIFIALEINQTYDRRSREKDRKYREDERQKDLIKDYFEQITKLLVDRQLATKSQEDLESAAARALTVAFIKELQPDKIKQVVSFLVASGLSGEAGPNLLVGVDFNGIQLDGADFSQANLNDSRFEFSSLKETIFYKSDLQNTHFDYANLADANLSKANLYKSTLSHANLSRTDLNGATLRDAYLDATNLSEAKNLTEEQITSARLWQQAKLKGKWTYNEKERKLTPKNRSAESENQKFIQQLEVPQIEEAG